jgi:hypothetical protein
VNEYAGQAAVSENAGQAAGKRVIWGDSISTYTLPKVTG